MWRPRWPTRSRTATSPRSPRGDVEAFRLYAEGVKMNLQSREEMAIPLLEAAVEKDPDFAMAHAKLSVAYGNEGNAAKAEEFARNAFERSDKLPPRERHYIRGPLLRHEPGDRRRGRRGIHPRGRDVPGSPGGTAQPGRATREPRALPGGDPALRGTAPPGPPVRAVPPANWPTPTRSSATTTLASRSCATTWRATPTTGRATPHWPRPWCAGASSTKPGRRSTGRTNSAATGRSTSR